MINDVCVFVSSSDNTFDVFELVSASVVKSWPIHQVDLFVGLNKKNAPAPFQVISAPIGGWRSELKCQIDKLSSQYRYVILILDDFFFHERVDETKLNFLLSVVRRRDIKYLRLKPLVRSGLGHVLKKCAMSVLDGAIVRLPKNEPYYSSLQVAIWERSYLSEVLGAPGSIWDFEHQTFFDVDHYAVEGSFLNYEHLVEKGKWFRHAPELLGKSPADQAFRRGFESSLIKHSKFYNKVKLFLFGYSIFRLKRKIFKKSLNICELKHCCYKR